MWSGPPIPKKLLLVLEVGLEPTRPEGLDLQSSEPTNCSTPALWVYFTSYFVNLLASIDRELGLAVLIQKSGGVFSLSSLLLSIRITSAKIAHVPL